MIVGGSHLAAGPKGGAMTSGVHDIVIVHEIEGRTTKWSVHPGHRDAGEGLAGGAAFT